MSDIVRHAEDSKPGVDSVVHGRRVTSAHLAAAAGVVVMNDPPTQDELQVEAVMAVQERKDQGRIFVWVEAVVPEGHRITTWLSVLIVAHNSVDSSKRLDVMKVVAEWRMEDGTRYSTVRVQVSAKTGMHWSCVAQDVQEIPGRQSDVAFEPPPPSL